MSTERIKLDPIYVQLQAPRTALMYGVLDTNYSDEDWLLIKGKYLVFDLKKNGDRDILTLDEIRKGKPKGKRWINRDLWFLENVAVLLDS